MIENMIYTINKINIRLIYNNKPSLLGSDEMLTGANIFGRIYESGL